MLSKLFALIVKNMLRSKTRLLATAGGCAVATFIVCFFLAANYSLTAVLKQAGSSNILVVRQKDRY